MIEKIVLDYLSETLNVHVCAEVPPDRPSAYVLIEKTGGSIENFIEYSTLAVRSVAPSLFEAAELNELVIEAMAKINRLDEVAACRLNSNYNFTNPSTKEYRYQAVFDLVR